MARPKLLYVCLDGLGDEPNPELGDRTPLEAAETPFLDSLAANGRNGLVYTVGRGIAPESDIAVFAILGYDPREQHPGRGVLEALGVGMGFSDGDLALRANFATAEGKRILDRRVGRDLTSEESQELAAEVNAKVSLDGAVAELRATVEHRGALVIRSSKGPLSSEISNTDPAYRKEGPLGVALETFEPVLLEATPLDASSEAERAADLVNDWTAKAAEVLAASEVNERRRSQAKLAGNLVVLRDAGDHIPHLELIKDRFGPMWGCFVEMPVERGIAMVLGMTPVTAPAGIPTREQYPAWAELAAQALGQGGYDALYIHIKGPDVPAHDGRGDDKRANIAEIDELFFGELLPRLDTGRTVVAVTADHSTSCARKAHTDDPVPLLVSGPGISPDGARSFGEREAKNGALGVMAGVDILPKLVELLR